MTLSGRGALIIAIGAVVSLCFNLFLVGLMVGSMWHDRPPPWRPGWMAFNDDARPDHPGDRPDDRHGDRPGDHDGGKGGFMGPVPPEIREQLKEILAPHDAEIMQMRKAMHEARIEVAKQMVADPFDPAAFKQALDNLQQQSSAMQRMIHDMMLEAVPKLSPESRQLWAERWMVKPRPVPPPPSPQ